MLRRGIAYSAALGICSFRAYLISVILRWTLKELRTFIGVVWFLLVSAWSDLFFRPWLSIYAISMLASDRGCSEFFSLSLRKSLRKILPRVTVERWGVCVCVSCGVMRKRERAMCTLVSLVKQAWLMSIQHATKRPSKTVIREKSWWIIQDRSNESDSLWAHRPLVNLESLTLEIEMKKIQQTDRIGVSLHWDSLWHARRCDQKF